MEDGARDLAGTVEGLDFIEPTGDRRYACRRGDEIVGRRVRDASGRLLMEWSECAGVRHGSERNWAPDGSLEFETNYVDGLEHGVAAQWHAGELLGIYQMDHGTGVDLWRNPDGSLAEERHCVSGQRDGFERWWTGDDATIWQEGHYQAGVPHGVFRLWSARGRLRRGYPQYFVAGRRVTMAAYRQAAAADTSLPPLVEADNLPIRELPLEYRGARRAG
jgi:hypothetical protein